MALAEHENEVASNRDEAIPGRYYYRPADSPPQSFWRLLAPGSAPLNTRAGHDRLVSEFNTRDKRKWVWQWEEVLRNDFDYPSFLAPDMGSRQIASCIWICLRGYDQGPPLADWLKTLKGRRQAVNIPDGKAKALGKGHMFSPAVVDFAKGKKVRHETYANPEQAALAAMLANLKIHGQIELPTDEAACAEWRKAVENRISEARSRFEDLAVYRSDMERVREEIVAVLLRWFIHGRE
jgi:hypothetical protein